MANRYGDFASIEYQGFSVLQEDMWAMGQIIMAGAPVVLSLSADIGVEYAREIVPYLSGDTQRSISIAEPGQRALADGIWYVRWGAETEYAPALEYGTLHSEPRPFLGPSLDLAGNVLASSMFSLMNIALGARGVGGGASFGRNVAGDPRVKSSITKYRSFLYSTSKMLGDISVFGGREFLGPLRSSMYSLARGLGDIQSSMTGTVGSRITRRLSGRVTGHIVGFGSHSLSSSRSYSAFVGGTGGHRTYQRVAGRFGSSALSGIASLLP